MAVIYNKQDKKLRLARPYGTHNIHSGNGKLLLHETTAVGSEKQVKARLALAESSLHSIKKATYDGIDVPSQYYTFYKESGAVNPASTIFPTYQLNPGMSFIDFTLPPGMAADNQPDKFVVQAECLEISDYNAQGQIIDFGYSENAASIAADGIIHLTGMPSLIEYESLWDFSQWTKELISVIKDSQTVNLPRFPLNIFTIPPYGLKGFLDRVCELTCSDWTWAHAKIRFLPGSERPASFDFDLSKLNRNFTFQAVNGKARFNGVRVYWRDRDDVLLREGEPVVIDRREDENELENFYEVDAGVCRKDVAERFGNYCAKTKCDLTDFGLIHASKKAYVVLPGDIGTVTHPTPSWTNKRVKVIKKTEREDRESRDGIEIFKGYGVYFQVEPQNPYSDTDHTPLVTRQAPAGQNPYAAPPSAQISLQPPQVVTLSNKTKAVSIFGSALFGEYAFGQTCKILWTKPDGSFEYLREFTPDANNQGTFRANNLAPGIHWFKPITFGDNGAVNNGVGEEDSVEIPDIDFTIEDFVILPGVVRSYSGLNPQGNYTGEDTSTISQAAIGARIDSATVVGDDLDVLLGVFFNPVFQNGVQVPNQTRSAAGAEVEVFDQFGDSVKKFSPAAINRIGGQVVCKFSRKYADALTGQGYFKIRVLNAWGWSFPVYLRLTTITTEPPAKKLRENCPLDGYATPFSSSAARAFYQFTGNVNLLRRKPGDLYFEYQQTGISASPYLASGLAEFTDYELQFESAADTTNRGNIFRVKTKQQGEAAPERPSPTNIAGQANGQTQLDFSCIAAANVETEVFVNGVLATTKAAVAVGQTINHSITGLSASTSRSVYFRHKWGAGDYSEPTEEITRTTAAVAPPAQPPRLDYAGVEIMTSIYATVVISCTRRVAGGALNVYYNTLTSSGNFAFQIPDGQSSGQHDVSRPSQFSGDQERFYYVEQVGVAGSSDELQVTIPQRDAYQKPWGGGEVPL